MFKKWFKKFFDILERPLPYFFTFHLRPKKAEKIGVVSDKLLNYPKIAIVIQGPIIYDQDFTLETIKIYKKIFPQVIIILSTWNYEDTKYIEKIKNEIGEVLLNKIPEEKGVQNINYQIVSSLAGINRAKELGVQYVMKTRTDIRIYDRNSIEFLCNILNQFPAKGGYKQNKRIVGLSLNTFKYRLYGLSDINLFGEINDMILYWSAELDKNGSAFVQMKIGLCEVYLATQFLKKVGKDIAWTLKDSWQTFADNFCIVDEQCLDIYWYKYARIKEHRYVHYDVMRNDQEMTFNEWFNIYVGLDNKVVSDSNIVRIIP